MKTVLKIISVIGLLLTVVPSVLVFTRTIAIDEHKVLMIVGMFLWFLSAPFWMKEKTL
ncbi:MAG: hypothetical protein WD035_10155 [Balneolaceae bacterium]